MALTAVCGKRFVQLLYSLRFILRLSLIDNCLINQSINQSINQLVSQKREVVLYKYIFKGATPLYFESFLRWPKLRLKC